MENSLTAIEKLIQKLENYSKTTLELFKYELVDKIASIFSYLALKLIFFFVFVFIILFVNIGLAIWIGEELGKIYYGFFAIAVGYIFLLLVLYVFRKKLFQIPLGNSIISKLKSEGIL